MVAFLTVHKMTKRQPAKKATGAFMAVANRHIYPKKHRCITFWGGWKYSQKSSNYCTPRPMHKISIKSKTERNETPKYLALN